MASDNSNVKWADLKHYTEKFKEYIDYKLVPVPADCEQLKFKIYSPAADAYFGGWTLPTGYSKAVAGTTFEYYFVEDNKLVAKCKAVCSGVANNYTFTITWLDNTTCPSGISFFTPKGQGTQWGICCSMYLGFKSYTLTASALTSNTQTGIYTVDVNSITNLINAAGRYTVYARKIA